MKYIQPDKPSQNAYIERFNRTLREEVLNAYAFLNIEEARQTIKKWRLDYNQNRPHQALENKTPLECAA